MRTFFSTTAGYFATIMRTLLRTRVAMPSDTIYAAPLIEFVCFAGYTLCTMPAEINFVTSHFITVVHTVLGTQFIYATLPIETAYNTKPATVVCTVSTPSAFPGVVVCCF